MSRAPLRREMARTARQAHRERASVAGNQAIAAAAMLRQTGKRAWNATADNRITKNHWGSVTSTAINQDLVTDLADMRNRARWERQNNGILEGIVTSNALDVVGADGPILQVTTTDERFKATLERIWSDWWAMPDFNQQMSGPDVLKQNIRQEWDCGESLVQLVNDPEATGPIQLRLLTIHPRRLESPYGVGAGDLAATTLGVRRSATGRPLSYWIREDIDTEFNFSFGTRYANIPAANIIHDYAIQEPGQARGIPLLASCLQVVAQLREWDGNVQQAMRMAAMLGMILVSPNGDVVPMEANTAVDLEGGQMMVAPPGYDAKQMTPQQPGNQYEVFRNSKLAEIGRPACMPLMQVNLDSSSHSYSSARFDGQGYDRVVKDRQARMKRTTLDRLLTAVRLEAQRAGALRATPADLMVSWVWPARPHVDPVKEKTAQDMSLKNGTQSVSGVCAENGLDADVVEAQRASDSKTRDLRIVQRIAHIHTEIAKAKAADPTLKITWAQVLTALGAESAPGAYLQGASMADMNAGRTTDEPKDDAA